MLLDGLTVRENILVPRIIKDKVEPEAEQLADALLSCLASRTLPQNIRRKYRAVSGSGRQLQEA